jgi:hypothetical protein
MTRKPPAKKPKANRPPTKKRRNPADDDLNRIGSLLYELRDHYVVVARRYQAERKKLEQIEAMPKTSSTWPLYVRWRENSLHMLAEWREQCEKCRQAIATLRREVANRFPGKFAGTLREVRANAREWHDIPLDQWEPLLTELDRIEEELHLETPTNATATERGRPGRKELLAEELKRRLDDVALMGIAKYCREMNVYRSTVYRWKMRFKKLSQQ